jgi:hypothetical protein
MRLTSARFIAILFAALALNGTAAAKDPPGKAADKGASGHAHGQAPGRSGDLPPGLKKRAAQGKPLPPGWVKKLSRGHRVPDDIWVARIPLPHEVLIKLPPPPPGVISVRIEDKIVRVIEKTRELHDILHH